MSPTKIIGIFLVRNEDIFIEQAVQNVIDFCDQVLIADNYSTDHTWDLAKELARSNNKIQCQRIKRTHDSHEMIQEFSGTNTWIFGVDGDEIYDPERLIDFRQELLSGKYDDWWVIFGNVLNCTSLDLIKKEAAGHLAPPCRSMTKLYNFKAIFRWDGPCLERMLGGTPVFKGGYDLSLRLNLHEKISWEESNFRCLHTCFLHRSSQDPSNRRDRSNPAELAAKGFLEKIGLGFIRSIYRKKQLSWKREKYLRGDLVRIDVSSFFPLN